MTSEPALPHTNLQRHTLVTLFVLSFALDFKGAAGGSFIQYAMAGLNTIAFLLLAISYRIGLPKFGFAAFVVWGWVVFLAEGSIGAWLNAVPFGHYIRTIYPFALFWEGFLAAWWVSRDTHGAVVLIKAMTFTAMISLFFTFWWGFYFSGKGIGAIRYQILSPLIPFLIVVSGYDLFFTQRRRLRALVFLVLALGIIALSVTRGMLLVVGMVASVVLIAWLWNIVQNKVSLPGPIGRALLWGIAAGAMALFLTLALSPDVIGRWIHRGLGVAHDVTFWTRVAAAAGQWDQLWTHQFSWISGLGFGHSYRYAELFAQYVYPYISTTAFNTPKWFPGEFMWVTPLYYSGFLAGAIAVIILLWGAFRSFRILIVLLYCGTWQSPITQPTWVGTLGYFAFLGLGFTANPFIIRLSAFFLGLTLGLIGRTQKLSITRFE